MKEGFNGDEKASWNFSGNFNTFFEISSHFEDLIEKTPQVRGKTLTISLLIKIFWDIAPLQVGCKMME